MGTFKKTLLRITLVIFLMLIINLQPGIVSAQTPVQPYISITDSSFPPGISGIEGWYWCNDPVNMTIHDTSGLIYSAVVPEAAGAECYREINDPPTLEPGMIVTWDDGYSVKSAVVESWYITDVDWHTDLVTGEGAEPFEILSIGGHVPKEWGGDPTFLGARNITANADGTFIVDFSVPGSNPGEEPIDIQPWQIWSIDTVDMDGDSFGSIYMVPSLYMRAVVSNGRVIALGGTVGNLVELKIFESDADIDPIWTDIQPIVERTDEFFQSFARFRVREDAGFELEAGMKLTMTESDPDGEIDAEMIVDYLMISSADPDTDHVYGIGTPGDEIIVSDLEYDQFIRYALVGSDGAWVVDFANPGSFPEEQRIFDITPETGFHLMIYAEDGHSFTRTFWEPYVVFENLAAMPSLLQAGGNVVASSTLMDIFSGGGYDLIWDWGDGETSTGFATGPNDPGCDVSPNGVLNCRTYVEASHVYNQPGVYQVILTVAEFGHLDISAVTDYVIVYDPNYGHVTGGGWFWSPSGAFRGEPEMEGRAILGFISRYKKGASIPDGSTEFQFKAGNLNFHSSSYDWLVVTGSNYARFKGAGKINGSLSPNSTEYKFMIWAGDGTGANGADTFRIKIWYEQNDAEIVVYDNGMDQPIGGGSIQVHKAN